MKPPADITSLYSRRKSPYFAGRGGAVQARSGEEIWPAVKPVYEKMADIVAGILKGRALLIYGWRAALVCTGRGGTVSQTIPGVTGAFTAHSLFMTPLAIASSGREKAEGYMQNELQTALFQAFDTLNLHG